MMLKQHRNTQPATFDASAEKLPRKTPVTVLYEIFTARSLFCAAVTRADSAPARAMEKAHETRSVETL
jgi:hypothetical protein